MENINIKRTLGCGELRKENIGQRVELLGWVSKSRNLGSLLFIDLRDSTGIVQLSSDHPDDFPEVKSEYVCHAVGTVVTGLLRYLCSFLSGYIVWKDYETAFEWMEGFGWGAAIANMGENALCWLYSAVYNATYMIPETILTVIAMVVLAGIAPKLFNRQH